ncbi:MAG: GIY-YIG nuclease family protein [Cyanobacteria bacterium P01_H01_bin.121]
MTISLTPQLQALTFCPYLDAEGRVTASELAGQVGIYAIFDQAQTLCYVGFSRDIYFSLKQHLVVQPEHCYWFKFHTVQRPNRTELQALKQQWLVETNSTAIAAAAHEAAWATTIDARQWITPTEQAEYDAADEQGKRRCLKQLARRIEAERLQQLASRGVNMPCRFDPKLKEQGLLALKAG